MLFNSIEFLVFLPTVFLLYWLLLGSYRRAQNFLIVVASYIFYGWWDWRFLSLIILSTAVDYILALNIARAKTEVVRKGMLIASLTINLGILGFFKYWNFFVDSWLEVWDVAGVSMDPATVQLILPVGISFYTFQTLSYTIDVYRRRLEPTNDVISFAAFVAFFPQLVAGPIERATNLLPQFFRPRVFTFRDGAEGLRQILWGMFKKVAIADQLAPHVEQIFSNYQSQSSVVLVIGAIFFAIQIYCDFSGYSDIAIGTARLFGFNLMVNFRYPYFARDIGEFWRRWHISLSTWFRDYLYIPLGGSRASKLLTLRNIIIVFAVSGLWHGANWTFVAWGGLHALLFLPFILAGQHRRFVHESADIRALPSLGELAGIVLTFTAVCIAWVFFRSDSVTDAVGYFTGIIGNGAGDFASLTPYLPGLCLIIFLVSVDWVSRLKPFPLSFPRWPGPLRYSIYFGLFYWTVVVSQKSTAFIYFQF